MPKQYREHRKAGIPPRRRAANPILDGLKGRPSVVASDTVRTYTLSTNDDASYAEGQVPSPLIWINSMTNRNRIHFQQFGTAFRFHATDVQRLDSIYQLSSRNLSAHP